MVLRSEWLWGGVGKLTNNHYFCRPILDFVTLSVLSLQVSMRKARLPMTCLGTRRPSMRDLFPTVYRPKSGEEALDFAMNMSKQSTRIKGK